MARGILAELNRIAKKAAREAERKQRTAETERLSSIRRMQQAQKAEVRLAQQIAKASEKELKRLEKELKEAHIATRTALAEEKNAALGEIYDEVDTLLLATLDIDDFVDLEAMKVTAQHPPFDRAYLERPTAAPAKLSIPPKPTLELPPAPTGVFALFGKKRHENAVETVRSEYYKALERWELIKKRLATDYQNTVEHYRQKEAERLNELRAAREQYAVACEIREKEAFERNKEVDKLIAELGYGVPEAIEEYVSIVLSNSVYPEHFPVQYSFSFDAKTAELTLRTAISPPDYIPTIKSYKYIRSKDEIRETHLSQKACRDRYASTAHQVALRTLHEVFEADRRGLIQAISLEVGTSTNDPATGNLTYIPFVAVGVERSVLMELDLSAVVPEATLQHLGASMSKNPYALESAITSGIRRS